MQGLPDALLEEAHSHVPCGNFLLIFQSALENFVIMWLWNVAISVATWYSGGVIVRKVTFCASMPTSSTGHWRQR